jgi:hypothetical protein
MTVTFTKDKTTKHKVRYTTHDGEVVGSLFLSLDDPRATADTLVVEVPDA